MAGQDGVSLKENGRPTIDPDRSQRERLGGGWARSSRGQPSVALPPTKPGFADGGRACAIRLGWSGETQCPREH
jgi:hypothetical protein